jgi:starch synthase
VTEAGAAIIPGMKILFVASEMAPFAKVGGLADVAGALPEALARRGHEVRVVMPAYDVVADNGFRPHRVDPEMLGLDVGSHRVVADVLGLDHGSVSVTFIDVPSLYHRGQLYSEASDEPARFAVLSRAALELCRRWRWEPDVIHCNDWQTGLIPLYLKTIYADEPLFSSTRTVLTIHNLAYQGVFEAPVVEQLGLDAATHLLPTEHLKQGRVSFLATGIVHADTITTVSPTYAREIVTPEHGHGLDGLLRRRAGDLVGILNGIDTEVWNPALDRHLPFRYSAKSLWRKEWNKKELLESLGLDHREGVPVFGLVSRLVEQKGIGLIPQPMSGIFEQTDARFVALGSGDANLEATLWSLVDRFPEQARFVSAFDEPLSHRIEAGVDVFLMPSRYEPSGLNQMYSLAYGTPPLVRKTGGLADTVEHWDPTDGTGTGFVFEDYDEGGLWWALNQALTALRDRRGWKRLQLNGMAIDNSWNHSAGRYEKLYRRLVA